LWTNGEGPAPQEEFTQISAGGGYLVPVRKPEPVEIIG